MSKKLKRTLKEENKVFNDEWKLLYFIVQSDEGKLQCLICDTLISTLKKYNAYSTHKDTKYTKLEGQPRHIAFKKLKEGKQNQKLFFKQLIHQDKAATEAS